MGSFQLQGATVAQVRNGVDVAAVLAPRPYLHPLRTLGGVTLTEAGPADHPHHLGLSLAFSDVNGSNFWGGSTFTRRGPEVLPNHGRQVPSNWRFTEGTGEGTVTWFGSDGGELALEQRSYNCRMHHAADTWSLSFDSVLRPAAEVERLSVSSSAVKGRAGAGYGGIFWRFASGDTPAEVLCSEGAGTVAAHGSLSPWLMVGIRQGGKDVSVVLAQEPGNLLPWFVRTEGYAGAGPAVAWNQPATADRAHPLRLSLHALVHDGRITSNRHVEELLLHHFSSTPDRTS
ncbi:PmoA family protein [Paenarthrobacter aurescens]|uniref:Oxidoreductase n=1 Tax=Paenarthrobacter aurescens TaxID=43663 RepID=A0A4Y3NDB2_PAEAU|nr:PmoA family protein [Paenarthrobacter aurescens]MDO6141945.1 PmoA family protein [Paenarthrobacter aurescens]MDO6145750.1 PmoA family protein [Paenarthrobacter aurescens]MDO6156994.1 PmoA family protein [Paenarthrobacter aurescens]MDO6160980.1 PmoA family protein [Paenarthrobacter aurescens]GEB19157.1 hypothetical protein AAU01_19120 [Paenarthrobacter aurescens]